MRLQKNIPSPRGVQAGYFKVLFSNKAAQWSWDLKKFINIHCGVTLVDKMALFSSLLARDHDTGNNGASHGCLLHLVAVFMTRPNL